MIGTLARWKNEHANPPFEHFYVWVSHHLCSLNNEKMNVSLITGATSGIGESLARGLAERKHNLLLVARNEQKLQQLCRHLSDKNGFVAQYIAAVLSQPGAAELVFVESLIRQLGVNLLVNNAGIGSSGEFAKDDLHGDLKMLQLNNDSLVTLCRLFLPEMIGRRNGSIVNVGSLASFFPSPYMAVYAASKMFVRSFTQSLTEEYKPYGVHVMLFCPGLTTTNFMNTTANDNDWGKILVEGAYTQTSDQVALELIQALDRRKTIHISGRRNALLVKMGSLFSYATITKIFAERKRKQMGFAVSNQ